MVEHVAKASGDFANLAHAAIVVSSRSRKLDSSSQCDKSEVELARRAAAGPPPHCGESSETSASERRVCVLGER